MAVHDVATDEAELAFEIERRMDLARDYAGLEVGGMGGDGIDDEVRNLFAVRVPVGLGVELLAEQAGDMLARWGETVVDSAGDQHLDDRLP